MNHKQMIVDKNFLQEELFETQQALFYAKTVREMNFLQSKLNYLKTKVKQKRR